MANVGLFYIILKIKVKKPKTYYYWIFKNGKLRRWGRGRGKIAQKMLHIIWMALIWFILLVKYSFWFLSENYILMLLDYYRWIVDFYILSLFKEWKIWFHWEKLTCYYWQITYRQTNNKILQHVLSEWNWNPKNQVTIF